MPNSIIKILPENLSNKIAAGEVVNRPASVVKELLENSVDAGAKTIDLYIKRAGKALIQVVDDGIGMTEEDALICLQRHATSKITSLNDLENINTFGFRGEALSAISAVSILEMKTEREGNEFGTFLRKAEDSEITVEQGSFSKGTSISIKNLFYNTPARRNFLKSNATELKHVIDWFNNIALSNNNIDFKFYNDDEIIFNYPAGSLEDRVKSVIADNITDVVVEVKELSDYVSVEGFAAKPTYLKKSKSSQYLFVNKRFVVSKSINHAVFSAYENILEKGDYPFFVLFLTIDPSKIDINVHPAKLEIKFDDEKGIYNFINSAIKKSLGSFDLVPSMAFTSNDAGDEKLKFIDFRKKERNDFSDRPNSGNYSKPQTPKGGIFNDEQIDMLFGSINTEIKESFKNDTSSHPFNDEREVSPKEIYHSQAEENDERDFGKSAPFLVSLHNKYILTQIKTGLMIIDQHVAHERILYEKALQSFSANIPFSQQLLFSQTFEVDPGEYGLLKELEPHLNSLGFELKFFSKNTIVIDGVPSDVKIGTEIATLRGILDEYKKNNREKGLEILDNIAKSYSCRTAIKAGDKLSETEMRQLVDKLFATSMPYVCPHGRPIVIKISLGEFDRRFGRT